MMNGIKGLLGGMAQAPKFDVSDMAQAFKAGLALNPGASAQEAATTPRAPFLGSLVREAMPGGMTNWKPPGNVSLVGNQNFNRMAGSDRLLSADELSAGASRAAGSDGEFSAKEFMKFMGRLGVSPSDAKNVFSTMTGGDFSQKIGVDRVVDTIFGNSDTNGDEKLSRRELRDGLRALAQPSQVVAFGRDAGVDAKLDRDEFAELARRAGITDESVVKSAFNAAAQGGDSINADQFKAVFGRDILTKEAFAEKFKGLGEGLEEARTWEQILGSPAKVKELEQAVKTMLLGLLKLLSELSEMLEKVQAPVEAAPVQAEPAPTPMRSVQAMTTYNPRAVDRVSVQIQDPVTNEWKEVARDRDDNNKKNKLTNMDFSMPLDNLDDLKVRLVNHSTGKTYGSDDQNQARVTKLADGSVRIAFEDRPFHQSDKSFNDAVITFKMA